MYLADYHLHTNNSFDSKQDIKDLCKKAIEMNLQEVAITDHFSVMKEEDLVDLWTSKNI